MIKKTVYFLEFETDLNIKLHDYQLCKNIFELKMGYHSIHGEIYPAEINPKFNFHYRLSGIGILLPYSCATTKMYFTTSISDTIYTLDEIEKARRDFLISIKTYAEFASSKKQKSEILQKKFELKPIYNKLIIAFKVFPYDKLDWIVESANLTLSSMGGNIETIKIKTRHI